MKKTATIRQFNLRPLVFISLFLFSLVPITVFFFFAQKEMVSELCGLEKEQQLYHMENELGALESKIDSYRDMIGFVSQLPAVLEILERGEELTGAISRETAYERYAGVLSRAFHSNQDVISIHILDVNSNVRFSFLKNPETAQYVQVDGVTPNLDEDFLTQTLGMEGKGFFISPLLLADGDSGEGDTAPHLLLRIFTPIVLKNEKIGVFCSDIDVGILTRSYPGITWVLNDGSFLYPEISGGNAFTVFPGLSDIFNTNKAGVWTNNQDAMAWVPFLKGKDVKLALWAGKKVTFITVRHARQKLLLGMLGIFLMLCTVLILISFWISKYTGRVFQRFLDDLQGAIFHHRKTFHGSKRRIREFSELSQNIAYIIDENEDIENERRKTIEELQKTLDEVKTLRGILPICSFCKNIRNDDGYYEQLESYISKHSDADFSHTICPDCMEKHYPEEWARIMAKTRKS